MESPDRSTADFAALVLGGEVMDGPAPAGSPLEAMIELAGQLDAGEITQEELNQEMLRRFPERAHARMDPDVHLVPIDPA